MCLWAEEWLNLHFRDEFTRNSYQFFTRAKV